MASDIKSEQTWKVKMNSIILEIRAAEGGRDAKDLVNIQFGAYVKMCVRERL
jgi:protein subunit release factor A